MTDWGSARFAYPRPARDLLGQRRDGAGPGAHRNHPATLHDGHTTGRQPVGSAGGQRDRATWRNRRDRNDTSAAGRAGDARASWRLPAPAISRNSSPGWPRAAAGPDRALEADLSGLGRRRDPGDPDPHPGDRAGPRRGRHAAGNVCVALFRAAADQVADARSGRSSCSRSPPAPTTRACWSAAVTSLPGRDWAPTAPGVISPPASALRPTGKA